MRDGDRSHDRQTGGTAFGQISRNTCRDCRAFTTLERLDGQCTGFVSNLRQGAVLDTSRDVIVRRLNGHGPRYRCTEGGRRVRGHGQRAATGHTDL